MKRLMLIYLLLFSSNSYSQDNSILSSLFNVDASYNLKESVLTITYKNSTTWPLLLWVGDFNGGIIMTGTDLSGGYLASPVIHEFYLFKKLLKAEKYSNSFFLRQDEMEQELKLSNYLYMGEEESLKINIRLKDKKLIKELQTGMVLKGAVTAIDLSNVELFFDRDKNDKFKNLRRGLMDISAKSRYFNNNYQVNLDGNRWEFGRSVPSRKIRDPLKHDMPVFVPVTAKYTAGDLIKNPNPQNHQETVQFPYSSQDWYRFSSKFVYSVEIEIKK